MPHVILIDNKRLRILREDPDGALIETLATEDADAITHERDARADRAGRVVNSASGQHASYDPKHSARTLTVQRWLKSVGLRLSDLLATGECDGLVLVASSRLLGLLRVALPATVRRHVLAEVPRDLVKAAPITLEKRLRPALQKAKATERASRYSAVATRLRAGD